MNIKRLVISISKTGVVYHYFRPAKTIDRYSTYWIEEEQKKVYGKSNLKIPGFNCYMIHKKRKLNSYDEVFLTIQNMMLEYGRNKKIEKVLYD